VIRFRRPLPARLLQIATCAAFAGGMDWVAGCSSVVSSRVEPARRLAHTGGEVHARLVAEHVARLLDTEVPAGNSRSRSRITGYGPDPATTKR